MIIMPIECTGYINHSTYGKKKRDDERKAAQKGRTAGKQVRSYDDLPCYGPRSYTFDARG